MTVLWAATGFLDASFDDSGETQAGAANPYFTILAAAVAEFRGEVVSPPGREIVAEFPDAVLTVRAAVEMQRRFLKITSGQADAYLRVGVHASNRDIAARIARHAKPAQILVTRTVREAVLGESDVRCTWQGQLSIAAPAGPTPAPGDSGEKEDLFEVVWNLPSTGTTPLPQSPTPAPQLKVTPPNFTPLPIAPPTPAPVPVFQRFDILGELGRGGMGIVYKARDRETNEIVALKVLKPELLENPQVLERFKNEMRLARKITHKNVCRIHDFHREDNVTYISMEFVEGESLRWLLDQHRAFSVEEGVAIARQLCAGLGEAHAQGVVHRDLKPQNVMLDAHGKITIMDFGIARSVESTGHTLTVGIIGTPAYMSPEQAEGKPVDHRTDIYALGLVLYELFTGTAAFSGETMVSVVMKQVMEAPRPPRLLRPDLPPNLERAILGCLEKNPANRFATVGTLDAALAGGAIVLPERAPTPPPPTLIEPTLQMGTAIPQVLPPLHTLPAHPSTTTTGMPPPPMVPAPPGKVKWWKTAMGITAMGCAIPTVCICAMVVAIVWMTAGRKSLPRVHVGPDGSVEVNSNDTNSSAKQPQGATGSTAPATVLPAMPATTRNKTVPAKQSGKETAAAAAEAPEQPSATPSPATPGFNINLPQMNLQIPMMPGMIGMTGPRSAQIVDQWIKQADKAMDDKKYAAAATLYTMALSRRPDDQTLKDKLVKAREALESARPRLPQ